MSYSNETLTQFANFSSLCPGSKHIFQRKSVGSYLTFRNFNFHDNYKGYNHLTKTPRSLTYIMRAASNM